MIAFPLVEIADQATRIAEGEVVLKSRTRNRSDEIGLLEQRFNQITDFLQEKASVAKRIATSSAVLVVEQGVKAVEAGVRQSTQAGEAIRLLTEGVSENAQAATQISVSAQQQLAGMDQMAQAMQDIKNATSQNLDSTRQAEVATHNLNDLGQKLKPLVGRYRI